MKQMLHITAIIALAGMIAACSGGQTDIAHAPDMQATVREKDSASENISVLKVSSGTCVFVLPTENQLQGLRRESASDDEYQVMIEEGQYSVNKAKEYLEMIHTASIDVKSTDTLDFVGEDGSHYSLSLAGMAWDLILFNGKEAPFRSDISNPEEECKKLYRKLR